MKNTAKKINAQLAAAIPGPHTTLSLVLLILVWQSLDEHHVPFLISLCIAAPIIKLGLIRDEQEQQDRRSIEG